MELELEASCQVARIPIVPAEPSTVVGVSGLREVVAPGSWTAGMPRSRASRMLGALRPPVSVTSAAIVGSPAVQAGSKVARR